MKPAYVTGLGLWSPGFANVAAWRERVPDPEVVKPPCRVVGSRLKRGSSRFSNMLGEVVAQAAEAAGEDVGAVATIYGSSEGEIETMVTLLGMLFEEDGKLSPNRFKNSVHNAASGLVSIGTSNTAFTTAVAAGARTFEISLLEGWALLDSGDADAVVVAVADDVPPPPLDLLGVHDALSIGLCLSRAGRPGALRLANLRPGTGEALAGVPAELRRNCASAGLDLVTAVLDGVEGTLSLAMPDAEGLVVDVQPA